MSARTTGILAVHVYGSPCDVDGLQRVADRHSLKIIYDAAHAFGTHVHSRGIGNFGDVTMFSFHATKLFHTAEGGALACATPSLKARIDDLRNFGIHGPDGVEAIGLNGKMTELQAALGLCVLDGIAAELARRRVLLERYQRRFATIDGVTWLSTITSNAASCQYAVVRIDEARFGCSRDAVHRELQRFNIFARKYFYPLCSQYRLLSPPAVGEPRESAERDTRRAGSAVRSAVRRIDRSRHRPDLRCNCVRPRRRQAQRRGGHRRMKRISFVLPVYRNEQAVTLTYQQICHVMTSDLQRYGYEIVFVDDGSDDGSPAELAAIHAADEHVRVVTFTRNFGQMAAILAGLKHASGDVIIQLSADLQDPIALVPQMVAEYERGSEVVACHREHREDQWSRRVTSRALYAILRLSLPQIPAGGFDYILLDRKVVDAFNAVDVRNRFFQGDILWFGYKTTFIPYTRPKRTDRSIPIHIFEEAEEFDRRDPRLVVPADPVHFAARRADGIPRFPVRRRYRLWAAAHNIPFTGWAPIMILILVIGGVLMLMLGIIGEYIWRIYDEVKGKPNYVVRQIH